MYPSDSTWLEYVKGGAVCSPWVTWVMVNMAFHFIWVSCLMVCQIYQVVQRAKAYQRCNGSTYCKSNNGYSVVTKSACE